MGDHLPDAVYVPTLSTAAAAQGLEQGPQSYDAAVCAPAAARLHGLEVLADGIGDMQAAVTRFVLVARPGALPEPTGADKTTVVLFQRDDHAGGLLALLEQFAARGINMTRLESRPTKESMGSYCFSIDLEGHVLDERVGEALMGLRRICAEVRFLGSYPRADRQRASIAPLTSDTDFTAARSWLQGIRSHRS
jgi:prephenate dehydratase